MSTLGENIWNVVQGISMQFCDGFDMAQEFANVFLGAVACSIPAANTQFTEYLGIVTKAHIRGQ